MDVHIPKLVRNWPEFLKEYGIIVLGVLTALLAEQAVQSIEWRHKIHSALADMDNELSVGDGPQAYVRLAIDHCVDSRLSAIRNAIEQGDRVRAGSLIDSFWVPRRTWDSLARESANASDVASHMPSDDMLQYRIAYEMVPNMNRLSEKELADLSRLHSFPRTGGAVETSEKLPTIEAVEGLRIDNQEMVRQSRFLLIRLKRMGLGLDRASLKKNFEGLPTDYADCLTQPSV